MKDDLEEFLKSATGLQLAYDTLKKSLPTIEKEKVELDKIINDGIKDLKNKIADAILESEKQYKERSKDLKTKEKNLLIILDSVKKELGKMTEKETNIKILLENLNKERLNIEKKLEEFKNNLEVQKLSNTEMNLEQGNNVIEESHSAKYFYKKYDGTGQPVVLTKKSWTNKYCFWVNEIDDENQIAIGKIYRNHSVFKKNATHSYREKFIMAPEAWVTEIIDYKIKGI